MTQRIISDTFWTDPYIEDLDPSEKLIFLYLLSNPLCNIAWAYEIKVKRIAYETWFDKDMIEKILSRFEKDDRIMRAENWIILTNFAKNQSSNPNVLKWMQRIIDGIPEDILKALKGFERLPYFTLLNLTLPNYTKPNLTILSKDNEIKISETTSNNSNILKTEEKEEVIYWNKEINDILSFLTKSVWIDEFKESAKWQRIYWKHFCNYIWKNWKEDFINRLKWVISDDFKASNSNSIKYLYNEVKAFIYAPIIETEKKNKGIIV